MADINEARRQRRLEQLRAKKRDGGVSPAPPVDEDDDKLVSDETAAKLRAAGETASRLGMGFFNKGKEVAAAAAARAVEAKDNLAARTKGKPGKEDADPLDVPTEETRYVDVPAQAPEPAPRAPVVQDDPALVPSPISASVAFAHASPEERQEILDAIAAQVAPPVAQAPEREAAAAKVARPARAAKPADPVETEGRGTKFWIALGLSAALLLAGGGAAAWWMTRPQPVQAPVVAPAVTKPVARPVAKPAGKPAEKPAVKPPEGAPVAKAPEIPSVSPPMALPDYAPMVPPLPPGSREVAAAALEQRPPRVEQMPQVRTSATPARARAESQVAAKAAPKPASKPQPAKPAPKAEWQDKAQEDMDEWAKDL